MGESPGIPTLSQEHQGDCATECSRPEYSEPECVTPEGKDNPIDGRMSTLEHALDQALLVMADLRNQLQVQDLLEEQLAETESFSQIQHRAILSLKQELRLAQNQIAHFQSLQDSHAQMILQIQDDLVLTALKKEELEIQVNHLTRREAQLQHQCLDCSDRCEQQENRIKSLEEQVTDLQEQVLHQVQQLREQETAIQHWKGRYQSFYRECQTLLKECDPHSENDRETFFQAFTALLTKTAEDDRFTDLPLSYIKVELPSFLGDNYKL